MAFVQNTLTTKTFIVADQEDGSLVIQTPFGSIHLCSGVDGSIIANFSNDSGSVDVLEVYDGGDGARASLDLRGHEGAYNIDRALFFDGGDVNLYVDKDTFEDDDPEDDDPEGDATPARPVEEFSPYGFTPELVFNEDPDGDEQAAE